MLKKEIKYTDFNGNETSDIHYFNLSKPELLELELEQKEGFQAMIERVVETRDNRVLVETFKKIILLAYGVKSEDGKRFIKSDELRKEFEQTAAYQELFMELASEDDAAVTFLKGIIPKDLLVSDQPLPGIGNVQTQVVELPQSDNPQQG